MIAFRPARAATICARTARPVSRRRHAIARAEDDNKVTREYNESDDKVTQTESGGAAGKGKKNPDGTYYIDELPVRYHCSIVQGA
jgi:hypothetical protein